MVKKLSVHLQYNNFAPMEEKLDPFFYRSLAIPVSIRADVIISVERNIGVRSPNAADIEYQFEVWNRFIADRNDPMKITCNDCVYKVVSGLRKMVKLWKENKDLAEI